MLITYMAIMVGAYIFTRMVIAGVRAYPNEAPAIVLMIRILCIAAAACAGFCTGMIVAHGAEDILRDLVQ